MRSVIGVALAMVATQATAFEFNGPVATFWNNLPKTRADVREKHAQFADRQVAPLSNHQRHKYNEAHHSMMAQRARLGMGKVGVAAGPTVEQQYAVLNSLGGAVLAFIGGMAYNGGDGDSKCYNAFESLIVAADTSTDILKKIYIPAYLPEIQIQLQDSIALTAGFYVDCSVDKFFNQIIHLASQEGITEISGRVAGAYLFEISDALEAYNAEEGTFARTETARRYGKATATVLNYFI